MSLKMNILKLVESIPLADTHEHILEEKNRLSKGDGPLLDDIGVLFNDYASSDLLVAGMPQKDLDLVLKRGIPVDEKWKLLKPHYANARNTGYLLAVSRSIRMLYGEEDLNDESVYRINDKISKLIAPGFTRRTVKEIANIDHCQVNSLEVHPFCETEHPDFLLQDIGTPVLIYDWKQKYLWSIAEMSVTTIFDYHKVIDGIFEKYASRAVATKNQMNYRRRLDFADVRSDDVAEIFEADLAGSRVLSATETKAIEDHLFHYCLRKADEYKLPVKIHIGYYGHVDDMPLSRLLHNGGDICDLLRMHHDIPFVFMHDNYPYQSELVAVCKHYTNAYADMCWAWIINPAAAVRFLKEFLMAAPVNKITTFGGDYRVVECVPGHASIARMGITQALTELVEEGWMRESDVEYSAKRIMYDNARELYHLQKKFGMNRPSGG